MRGFQLWVNLPAKEKMTPATYNNIDASNIPSYTIGQVTIKAIAGELTANDIKVTGAVTGLSTDPGYLDLSFDQDAEISIEVPDTYTTLLYVYEGKATVGNNDYPLSQGKLARLSKQGLLRISATAGSRVLVITGKPIGEPIVQQGPFVMNTAEEIQQAVREYNKGTLV